MAYQIIHRFWFKMWLFFQQHINCIIAESLQMIQDSLQMADKKDFCFVLLEVNVSFNS